MPTSKEARVRVEGFWQIIPSVRPGRRRCSSPACCFRLSSSARSRTWTRSSRLQSATRVNDRPFTRPRPSSISTPLAVRWRLSPDPGPAPSSLLLFEPPELESLERWEWGNRLPVVVDLQSRQVTVVDEDDDSADVLAGSVENSGRGGNRPFWEIRSPRDGPVDVKADCCARARAVAGHGRRVDLQHELVASGEVGGTKERKQGVPFVRQQRARKIRPGRQRSIDLLSGQPSCMGCAAKFAAPC